MNLQYILFLIMSLELMTVKIVTQEQQKKDYIKSIRNLFCKVTKHLSSRSVFQTCYFTQLNPDPGKISLIPIQSDLDCLFSCRRSLLIPVIQQ